MIALLLALLVQSPDTLRLDVPLTGVLSDSSAREPGGRRAALFELRCLAGLGLRIDVTSSWDNIAFVVAAGNRVLARDDDGGAHNNARISWTCPDDEVYRVAVASFHEGVGGRFEILVTATNDIGKPRGLALLPRDTVVRAMLPTNAPRYDGHPVAWFGYQCRRGDIIGIEMVSQWDNMLFLFGPAGRVDWSDDADGTNARLMLRCVDDAVYRIGAAAREGRDAGPYRLHLRNLRL